MVGPCLCGDLCCPNCGDPGRCQLEEALEPLCDWLFENVETTDEIAYLKSMLEDGLRAYRIGIREYAYLSRHMGDF